MWCFRYRTLDGRQRRLTLGVFSPGDDEIDEDEPKADPRPLTLKAARRKARQARAVVENGADPAAEKRKAKEAAKAEVLRTFDDLAQAYLKACETGQWKPKGRRKRERTIKDERAILRRHVTPTLGKLPIGEVTRAGVKRLLRTMAAKGIGAQTNRAHAVIRQVFSWAITEERVETNPATGFDPIATETARARVISDDELKALWAAIQAPRGVRIWVEDDEPRPLYLSRPVAISLQLAALLLQRRAEVVGMRRSELNLPEKTWLIPPERTKSGRPHLVPLTARAVELIEEALKLADFGREAPSGCVFPGRRETGKSMRPDSVTHALADVALACGIEGITVHDLRRTGASAMASERLGLPPFIISKVLGHTADTGGAAAVTLTHYAVYDFVPEKRRALEAWEDLLLGVVGERLRGSKIRSIAGGAA